MNIIEAVKSGKRFRRRTNSKGAEMKWISHDGVNFKRGNEIATLFATDITAEDWEIEEPKLELTKTDIIKAHETAFEVLRQTKKSFHYYPEEHIHEVLRVLGFDSEICIKDEQYNLFQDHCDRINK